MNIVDSQVHIWGADTPQRRWPPGRAKEAQKPYPISQETLLFQMDLAGVRRMVLVPGTDRRDHAARIREKSGHPALRTVRPVPDARPDASARPSRT